MVLLTGTCLGIVTGLYFELWQYVFKNLDSAPANNCSKEGQKGM